MSASNEGVKIDIALASYNGSKYIEAQLESILNQSHTNLSLIISDDGSTDNTVDIILEVSKKDSRVKLVNKSRVGGVVNNFNCCLSFCDANYIMLSDQDDIWLPDKIENMLFLLLKEEREIGNDSPMLCYSDLKLVDSELNLLAESFYKANNLNPFLNQDLRYLTWRSSIYGCTCIFNQACLKQALPFPAGIPMHDHWLGLVALNNGKLSYHDVPTILYRQHSNNVVGGDGFNSTIWSKLKKIKKLFKSVENSCYGSSIMQANIAYKKKRFKFIIYNVLPFFYEKPLYSIVYTYHFLFKSK
ncbi:MAG: glycosyltransferase family 2 protein [Aeromonas sp.]